MYEKLKILLKMS